MSKFIDRCAISCFMLALGVSQVHADDSVVAKTRYGILSVSRNQLAFNNVFVTPPILANAGLFIDSKIYQSGDTDLVIVGNVGGTMCPLRLRVALIGKLEHKISDEFGTCSEDFNVVVKGTKVIVTQPKFAPRGAPEVAGNEAYEVDTVTGVVTK